MKSYKRNITTASSKRSRRNIIPQVTHKSKDKSSNVFNNNKQKNTIGNNKYKSILCHGCNNELKFYKNISLFMNKHVHKTKHVAKFTQNVFVIKFFMTTIILNHIKAGKVKIVLIIKNS